MSAICWSRLQERKPLFYYKAINPIRYLEGLTASEPCQEGKEEVSPDQPLHLAEKKIGRQSQ